eukprot:Nk52_evm2s323 gene=Nk52_evmTU2s323
MPGSPPGPFPVLFGAKVFDFVSVGDFLVKSMPRVVELCLVFKQQKRALEIPENLLEGLEELKRVTLVIVKYHESNSTTDVFPTQRHLPRILDVDSAKNLEQFDLIAPTVNISHWDLSALTKLQRLSLHVAVPPLPRRVPWDSNMLRVASSRELRRLDVVYNTKGYLMGVCKSMEGVGDAAPFALPDKSANSANITKGERFTNGVWKFNCTFEDFGEEEWDGALSVCPQVLFSGHSSSVYLHGLSLTNVSMQLIRTSLSEKASFLSLENLHMTSLLPNNAVFVDIEHMSKIRHFTFSVNGEGSSTRKGQCIVLDVYQLFGNSTSLGTLNVSGLPLTTFSSGFDFLKVKYGDEKGDVVKAPVQFVRLSDVSVDNSTWSALETQKSYSSMVLHNVPNTPLEKLFPCHGESDVGCCEARRVHRVRFGVSYRQIHRPRNVFRLTKMSLCAFHGLEQFTLVGLPVALNNEALLTSPTDGVFAGHNITFLKLRNTGLEWEPTSFFYELPRICSKTNITHPITVDISGNALKSISIPMCESMKGVRIDASNNSISNISFSGASSLTDLNLVENKLRYINISEWHNVFLGSDSGQQSIKLDLARNMLQSVTLGNQLKLYPILKEDNVATNRHVGLLDFSKRQYLTELVVNISSNQIGSLQEGAFHDLYSLFVLNATNNSISKLEGGFMSGRTCTLDHRCVIDLSHNRMGVHPKELNDALTFQGQNMSSFIREIDLSFNGLTDFPSGIASLLTSAWKNNSRSSDDSIPNSDSVNLIIRLHHNNITKLNVSLCEGLLHLDDAEDGAIIGYIYFDLSFNNITFIGENVFTCGNVRMMVNLNHNEELEYLPRRDLSKTSHLWALSLGDTKIRNLPESYADDNNTPFPELYSLFFGANSPIECCSLYAANLPRLTAAWDLSTKLGLPMIELGRCIGTLIDYSTYTGSKPFLETKCNYGMQRLQLTTFKDMGLWPGGCVVEPTSYSTTTMLLCIFILLVSYSLANIVFLLFRIDFLDQPTQPSVSKIDWHSLVSDEVGGGCEYTTHPSTSGLSSRAIMSLNVAGYEASSNYSDKSEYYVVGSGVDGTEYAIEIFSRRVRALDETEADSERYLNDV